jgi:hypothetical protein
VELSRSCIRVVGGLAEAANRFMRKMIVSYDSHHFQSRATGWWYGGITAFPEMGSITQFLFAKKINSTMHALL